MKKISLYGTRLALSVVAFLIIGGILGYILHISPAILFADSFVAGILVGMGGIFMRHPILGFPIPSYVRGACLGVFGGLSTILISPSWVFTLAGFLVAGALIDTIVTRYTAEGKTLSDSL